jgi:hypothetical protein
MSSVLAGFGAVGSRAKYLLATAASTSFNAIVPATPVAVGSSATVPLAAANGTSLPSLIDLPTLKATTCAPSSAVPSGAILQDLGRYINVYDVVTNEIVRRYVKVHILAGGASEGVSTLPVQDYYVLVWTAASAASGPVVVVRTG